jgi:hypothetical protein
VVAHVAPHLGVDAIGGLPEGQRAQRDQVALAEEVLDGVRGQVRDVDLLALQAVQEIVRREVDELHLVRLLEDRVGNRLPHPDASDLRHHVVQALPMLHVDAIA